jgi:hypothetical protein
VSPHHLCIAASILILNRILTLAFDGNYWSNVGSDGFHPRKLLLVPTRSTAGMDAAVNKRDISLL